MNDLQKFEQRQLASLKAQRTKGTPKFQAGDTVRVNVKITEQSGKEIKTRIQAYEGVVIAINGSGLNESFTVRKISYGEGVERVFPIHAPIVDSIELVRHGSVRRAKLYYLRERSGKSARIKEHADNRKLMMEAAEASEASSNNAAPEAVVA